MNVLLLSQFFSTTRGGGEYLFSIIAKSLAENDHKVWIITNKISDEDYTLHKNIKLIFVPPTLKHKGGLPPGFLDNIRYTINAVLTGMQIIKNEKIDIIHSNNFSPALAGSLLSYFGSIPHITSIWDIFSLCGKDYWHKWIKQTGVSRLYVFLGPRFEKLILKLPHSAIHTISETSKEDLIQFGATKPIHVILPAIENLDHEMVNSNPLQFVYVGRLVFYKNLEVVLKAIKIAKQTEPKIKLIIIGDGPHKKTLEELTKNQGLESNIEFKGYANTAEKMKSISSSNALIFPSLCEGFGLVILEAFSQNKPVFVSNIKPLSDIVSHGNNGYVLDPLDEKVWADYLIKAINNPGETSMMGKNGNHLLISSFNRDLMYRNLIEMYTEYKKQSIME